MMGDRSKRLEELTHEELVALAEKDFYEKATLRDRLAEAEYAINSMKPEIIGKLTDAERRILDYKGEV